MEAALASLLGDYLALDGLDRLGLGLGLRLLQLAQLLVLLVLLVCSPLTEPRNSRIPLPRDLPSSGSRFGPKTISAMISRTRISGKPILGIG